VKDVTRTKGCYVFPVVQAAQYRSLAAIKNPLWVEAMATLINSKKSKYFRWHDSGDVQDVDHLLKIFEVCKLTPDTSHWLPTREAWTADYLDQVPGNLTLRFSMPMVDQAAAGSWANTSTVVAVKVEPARPLIKIMNARTAERVGTNQFQTLHMVNTNADY
jgi:hypothetical protein